MDSAVVDAGNVAHREYREVLYVPGHRRVTGAFRGDEAKGALRPMAGGVRVVKAGRVEAMDSHGTADLEARRCG
jgi:hypothetical protein